MLQVMAHNNPCVSLLAIILFFLDFGKKNVACG